MQAAYFGSLQRRVVHAHRMAKTRGWEEIDCWPLRAGFKGWKLDIKAEKTEQPQEGERGKKATVRRKGGFCYWSWKNLHYCQPSIATSSSSPKQKGNEKEKLEQERNRKRARVRVRRRSKEIGGRQRQRSFGWAREKQRKENSGERKDLSVWRIWVRKEPKETERELAAD